MLIPVLCCWRSMRLQKNIGDKFHIFKFFIFFVAEVFKKLSFIMNIDSKPFKKYIFQTYIWKLK